MLEVADFIDEAREVVAPRAACELRPRVPQGLRSALGIAVASLLGLGFWLGVGFIVWQVWN